MLINKYIILMQLLKLNVKLSQYALLKFVLYAFTKIAQNTKKRYTVREEK